MRQTNSFAKMKINYQNLKTEIKYFKTYNTNLKGCFKAVSLIYIYFNTVEDL